MPIVMEDEIAHEAAREGAARCSLEQAELAGHSRPLLRPEGWTPANGLLVVLDGTRVLRRVARQIDAGLLDAARMPLMVGIDPDPADRGLAQYTPWHHPAYKPGAPDFAGQAQAFLEQTVKPVAREAQAALGLNEASGHGTDGGHAEAARDCAEAGGCVTEGMLASGRGAGGCAEATRGRAEAGSYTAASGSDGAASAPDAPGGGVGLLGYSLAGLFGLHCLMSTDIFSTYLLASPSTWYPGIVNRVARTPLACDARVVLACGANEGLDHPEPIAGIRQDTDRLVEALSCKLSRRPVVVIDELDHHRGLDVRLRALLGRWA